MPNIDEFDGIQDFLRQLSEGAELPVAVRESIVDLLASSSRSKQLLWYKSESNEAEESGRDSFVLVSRNRIDIDRILRESQADDPDCGDETPLGDDSTSFLGQDNPISLDDHTRGVQEHAKKFSRLAGLQTFESDFELAALWHDLGKIDFRFQTMLHDGDEVKAVLAMSNGELRAKSGVPYTDRARRQRAKRKARVPDNFRHEALSVILLRNSAGIESLESATDPDLVEFLIGSHHGFGRPFFPVCMDETPPDIDVEWQGRSWNLTGDECRQKELFRIDSDWADLFSRLNRRFGIWGLAWMEAVFRLADQAQSSLESQKAPQNQNVEVSADA